MGNGDPLIWQLLLLAVLIFVNAFFTCAELALISLNKHKLEKMSTSGNRKAKRILALISQPTKFIASVQVVITLAGLLSSAFAADNFSTRLTAWLISIGIPASAKTLSTISLVVITIILSFFTMVLCELVPKRIALKKADHLAFAISGFVSFTSRLFAPMVWLLTKTTNLVLRLFGISQETHSNTAITEEEILLLVDVGSAKGIIKEGDKEILHNVFEFDDKSAGEIMTHRREMELLWMEDPDGEWEKTVIEKRHAFFPICGETQDDIVGVLSSKDYLRLADRRRENVMANAVTPAQLIPTSVKINVLFRRMKKSHNHFAVVLDERGGLMGVISMKDLLEELVGNLDDDISSPEEQPLIQKTASKTWMLNGAISLDKAAQMLGVPLPLEKYETFAGFVFSLLGQIPEDGFQTEIEAEGLKIKILEVKERRLEKALVTLL